MKALVPLLLVAACGGGSAGDAGPSDAGAGDGAAADAGPIVDAPPSDAAPVYGVPCGHTMEPCVPATSQGCCIAADGDAGCTPNFGLCLADLHSCDGREDCGVSTTCCRFEHSPSCADPGDCIPDQGGHVLCHYASECPVWAVHCCQGECTETPC